MDDLLNEPNPFIRISQTKIGTKTVQNIFNHTLGLLKTMPPVCPTMPEALLANNIFNINSPSTAKRPVLVRCSHGRKNKRTRSSTLRLDLRAVHDKNRRTLDAAPVHMPKANGGSSQGPPRTRRVADPRRGFRRESPKNRKGLGRAGSIPI